MPDATHDRSASGGRLLASIRIGRETLDQMIAHALAERPRECCGVLVGADDEIVEAVRARNIAGEPTRFLVEPADHIAALRCARGRGLDVVGFYHSHPQSRAIPSPRDLSEASYPDCLSLIVGLEVEPAEVRAFRLRADAFDEVTLRVGQ